MSASDNSAVPVGRLADLPADEADLILDLRRWCDGPSGQAAVWNSFATRLGPDRGRAALRAFDRLVTLFDGHSRRPLMRNQVCCRCVGADECVFARVVSRAAAGAREDALLMAMLIVRPDMAPALIALAEQVGLMLRRGPGPGAESTAPKELSQQRTHRAPRRAQTRTRHSPKPPTIH